MKSVLGENFPLRTNILIGISVVVGAASGIYLLTKSIKYFSQISDKKLRKKSNEGPCNVCCVNLDVQNIKNCIKCVNCQKLACRGQLCSTWIPRQSGWECQLCNQSNESYSKSGDWLHQQMNHRFTPSARSEPTLLRDRNYPMELDRRSETPSSYGVDQKERVRELVEETLANMLGGSLDNVSVGPLYKNREYLPTLENGDCPEASHIKLKRLIGRIIQETLHLPNIATKPNDPGPSGNDTLPFFEPKKYQELLATAVLNKIVDSNNCNTTFEGNSETVTAPSDLDTNHNALISRKQQSGSVSSSSIEPESDCSITDPPTNISRCDDFSPSDSGSNLFADILNRNNPCDSTILGDYIAKHKVPLPDIAIESDSSNEENIPESIKPSIIENTWEENWLFKKKRSGEDGCGPIGMLVPCPKEDIKTQIGDRTADELSDLSEAGSDCEQNDQEVITESQNLRIKNRNVIGGKSPVGIFDELLDRTSLISTSSLADGDSIFTETKNEFVLGDDLQHDLERSTAFDANEAVNSSFNTQNLQNNLSNKIGLNNDAISSASSLFVDDLNIPTTIEEDSQLTKQAMQTVFISTVDIPEGELTSSSTDNTADRPTSTESSTTTDDTVQTAIDTTKSIIENPSVLVLHKELIPVPTESYIVSLSLLNNNYNNNNNTNPEDYSTAINSSNDSTASCTEITNSTTLNGSPSNRKEHTKHENLKNSAFCKQFSDEEDVVGHLSHLVPGSIAEREHKKWYNAIEMPNNPYSKEALARRLSGPLEKPFDIPNINSPLEKVTSEENKLDVEDKHEIDSKKVNYKRYSRDYYVNHSKHASGTSKPIIMQAMSTPSVNDDSASDKEISKPTTSHTIHRSHSWGDKNSDTADIFLARPVRVEESHPILCSETKLDYLNAADRNFYLLPTEEISNSSISTSEHSLSQAGDSLTPSEDSDTIRVYDLRTQETRLLRDDQVKAETIANSSDISKQHQGLRLPLTSPSAVKSQIRSRSVTPPAFKSLQPKRKLFDPRRMSEDSTLSTNFDNSARSNGTREKIVIEEDVVSNLPSVKALAKAFQNASQDSSPPVNRPKSASWKSLDVKSYSEKLRTTTNGETKSPATPSEEFSIAPVAEGTVNGDCSFTEEKVNENQNNVSDSSPQTESNPIHSEAIVDKEEQTQSPEPEKTPEEVILLQEEIKPALPQSESETVQSKPVEQEKQCPELVQALQAEIKAAPLQSEVEAIQSESIIDKEQEVQEESVKTTEEPIILQEDSKQPQPEAEVIQSEAVVDKEQQPQSPEPVKTPEEPTLLQEQIKADVVESTTVAEANEVQTSQLPQEERESNSLEWKEENMEIVQNDTRSTPPEEQNYEQSDLEEANLLAAERQSTPPNTPDPAENPEAENIGTVPATLVVPASLELNVEESVAEEQQPDQIEPVKSESPTSPQPEQNIAETPITSSTKEEVSNAEPTAPPADNDQPKQSIVEQKRAEISFTQESQTRDRPISPVLVPGKLKSSIAFFENLKNK